jgi:hypothetical protein
LPTFAIQYANRFISHLSYVEPTRSKMESYISQNSIVRRDIELIYMGLYLEAVCSFERFVEEIFIGLLVGRISHSSPDVVARVHFRSDIIAREVVLNGNRYVDWLPYEHTESRAKAYFRNGKPFTLLNPVEKHTLEDICCIRNAIAHRSVYATRRFEKNIIGTLPLLSVEKTPSGFLRSRFRIFPIQTRYENYVNQLASISMKLCT